MEYFMYLSFKKEKDLRVKTLSLSCFLIKEKL